MLTAEQKERIKQRALLHKKTLKESVEEQSLKQEVKPELKQDLREDIAYCSCIGIVCKSNRETTHSL